jgi:hypothetical protein
LERENTILGELGFLYEKIIQFLFRYLNSMFDTQIRSNSSLFPETVGRMITAAQIALNATLTYMMPKFKDNFHIDEGYVSQSRVSSVSENCKFYFIGGEFEPMLFQRTFLELFSFHGRFECNKRRK